MKLRSTAFVATALLALASASQAQTFSIRDLGAVARQSVSKGYSLNSLGQAAGVSSSPNGDIPTLFTNGQSVDLGTLQPNDVAIATGINGTGVVVGYEPFSSTPGNTFHAFLYANGALHDIHSPSLFPAGTTANAINGSGVVVGQGNLTSGSFRAFVYANGKMTDIGPPGTSQGSAVAINDAGEIIGNAYPGGAFVLSGGKFKFLTPPSGTSVSVNAISSTGEIAGTIFFNSGSSPHTAVYSNGVWTDLGGISGVAVHGTGVNSSGQVIATGFFPIQSYHPFRPGKHVGYIIRNGALVDLNTLIPANSGFTITDAIAINDAGQILCNANNSDRAVLLTPQ